MDVAWSSGQVKGFLLLGGAAPSFFSSLDWLWRTANICTMQSPSLNLARVKSAALGNDLPVASEEVFLGDSVLEPQGLGFYEFPYRPLIVLLGSRSSKKSSPF